MKNAVPPKRVFVLYTSVDGALKGFEGTTREDMDLANNAARIEEALRARGHVVEGGLLGNDPIAIGNRMRKFGTEIVFNLCECPLQSSSKEPHGAAFLELLKLPYTGNDPYTISVCQNKALAKCALSLGGIPTPQFKVYHRRPRALSRLSYPLIVKPLEEDGSEGISENSVVDNERQLRLRVSEVLTQYQRPVLVEEFVEGREFNVAVWGNGTADAPYEFLPPAELIYHNKRWRVCSFESKWLADHPSYSEITAQCPAEIPDVLYRRLSRLALSCAQNMRVSGYARVDFRLDRRGRLFVLEVNPNPDLSPGVGFARNAEHGGHSFEEIVERIVMLGLARGAR